MWRRRPAVSPPFGKNALHISCRQSIGSCCYKNRRDERLLPASVWGRRRRDVPDMQGGLHSMEVGPSPTTCCACEFLLESNILLLLLLLLLLR